VSQFALNLGLFILLICALFATCLLGSTSLPVVTVLQALVGIGDGRDLAVVWQIRLPRGLAAMFVGFALGMSGASLQGLLRNPLAEPGVLGVSATAALAATVAIYYGLVQFSMWVLPLAAIAGALLATAFIAAAALRSVSVVTLILIGVGLSSFSGALMSLLMNFAPHPFTLADMVNWMLGSVANRSFTDLQLTLPFLLVGVAVLWRGRNGLSVLTLGEEAARGSGLNLKRQRILVVLGSGLATGAAVAMSGAIGFVGIVAPHLVRPWVGYDPARTLLPSALMGGVLLVVADIVVRILPTTGELKLGVMAALLGAPVFIWIAFKRSNQSA
jgi:iron complex transport system permease protein